MMIGFFTGTACFQFPAGVLVPSARPLRSLDCAVTALAATLTAVSARYRSLRLGHRAGVIGYSEARRSAHCGVHRSVLAQRTQEHYHYEDGAVG